MHLDGIDDNDAALLILDEYLFKFTTELFVAKKVNVFILGIQLIVFVKVKLLILRSIIRKQKLRQLLVIIFMFIVILMVKSIMYLLCMIFKSLKI